MTAAAGLVEVELQQLPVRVWERAQEQSDALTREFALIAAEQADGSSHHELPVRLLELMDALTAQYGGLTGPQESKLWEASRQGQWVVPVLRYQVPRSAADAALALGRLLDEADDYCRAGEHLLTLAADEEVVRFRWWFLDQFVNQLGGTPPVPWPDYRRPVRTP